MAKKRGGGFSKGGKHSEWEGGHEKSGEMTGNRSGEESLADLSTILRILNVEVKSP